MKGRRPAPGRRGATRRLAAYHGDPLATLLTTLFAALLGPFLSWSCAAALKTARPLAEITGGAAVTVAEVDGMLAGAESLYRQRRVEAVREAAALALRACAAEPRRDDAIIAAVRLRVWLAERETDPAGREQAAASAVEIVQWCGRGGAPTPVCSYWLGAALGVQARERRSTGISALPRIEAAFKAAAAGDPTLEEAGPDRALALLYLRAPGWPTGPGDPELGLEHARKAVALRPDHPPNLLALAEALAANGEAGAAGEQYLRALDRATAAEREGEPDAGEWVSEARRAPAVRNGG